MTEKKKPTLEELCREWNEANAEAKAKTKAALYARNREHTAWVALTDFLNAEHEEAQSERLES